MSEALSNVEFAHKIFEHGHSPATDYRAQCVEIVEAALLAIVAIATAWSGYEVAKWSAVSIQEYNLASRVIVLSQEKATLAGQDRLYDITTFNGWVAAKVAGKEKLAAFYQRRFRPEYAAAFAAGGSLIRLTIPQRRPAPSLWRNTQT